MKNRRKGKALSSLNREERGRRLKLCVFIVMAIALAGAGVYVYYSYNIFPVKDTVIAGNKYISSEEVKSLMGMRGGEDLLKISSEEVSMRILKSPWVRAVTLRKEFPQRFVVKIEEAEPFALLNASEALYFVDERGGILDRLDGSPPEFLPVITLQSGGRASYPDAISLVKTIKEMGITGHVEVMCTGGGVENLTLRLGEMLVKMGQGEYEEKLERLAELDREIRKRRINVDYVDLRFANRVIVKPLTEVIR